MKRIVRWMALVMVAAFGAGCAVVPEDYDCKAYLPQNRSGVEVKVSLDLMMTYVLENGKPLLVTPVTIGTAEDPTPKGDFTVFRKLPKKRSNTYGFHVAGNEIRPGTRSATPPGARYVGYPMPYWVEFHPGYGFHSGGVWPAPRSHGCLRVHPNVAPKFFALVTEGTAVHIAQSLPEDATLGRRVSRPTDYADPDPPASVLITDGAFPDSPAVLFEAGLAPATYAP